MNFILANGFASLNGALTSEDIDFITQSTGIINLPSFYLLFVK